jgi:putative heme-binding domain-containing protein
MTFFGPRPGDELLTKLAADAQPAIRAKAARLLYQTEATAARATLTHLLKDTDALVRRTACESLERRGPLPDAAVVLPLLADPDRYVAFAARRLIELIPVNDWAPQVLRDTRPLSFSNAADALSIVDRLPDTSKAFLLRAQLLLQANPADADRVALLRTIELALFHGKLTPDSIPSLAPQLLTLYPTTDSPSNRELVRLLTFLHPEGAAQKFASQLTPASTASAVSANDVPSIPFQERLHIAAHASRLPTGWTADTKLTLLKFYEQARTVQGGYSVDKYVEVFTREFLANLSLEERGHLIAGGEKWPGTALSALASLPKEPGADILAIIRELDQKIAPRCARSDLFRRLRVGTIAVLGTTQEPASQEYLRSVYRNEPESRDPVAMSLAQHPDGENWKYLVDSLKTAQGAAAQDILAALAKVDQRPTEAAPYRNVILLGLTLADNGAPQALTLLTHWNANTDPTAKTDNNPDQAWSGLNPSLSSPSHQTSRDWPTAFTPWQHWYAQKFPNAPPAEPDADAGRDKWSSDELLTFLASDAGNDGDAGRGELVFSKAQCAACHRVAGLGETVGPDLTTVASRFQRKEILQSIVNPSHDISDQYASRVVLSGGKTYAGLVAEQGSTVTVLLSTGKKIELSKADVDEIKPSNISAMPTGLLNPLTLEEVADLFAYFNAAATKSEIAKRDATEKK